MTTYLSCGIFEPVYIVHAYTCTLRATIEDDQRNGDSINIAFDYTAKRSLSYEENLKNYVDAKEEMRL